MKYLEELKPGDFFEHQTKHFLLTSDFNSRNMRMAISVIDGNPRWLDGNISTNSIDVYKLDQNNNLVKINSDYDNNQNQNIS
jgi:hypothetical protein